MLNALGQIGESGLDGLYGVVRQYPGGGVGRLILTAQQHHCAVSMNNRTDNLRADAGVPQFTRFFLPR